jgi:hypothetical protein
MLGLLRKFYLIISILSMKKPLFGTYSLLALSVPAALFTLASNAQAAGSVIGSTATTNMVTSTGSISNIINQSGLSASYTSGHWYRLSKSAKTDSVGLRRNEKIIKD